VQIEQTITITAQTPRVLPIATISVS